MGRTKPKQQSKSPNKRIEESDEQDFSIIITPQPATSRKHQKPNNLKPQTQNYFEQQLQSKTFAETTHQ
jgi:hypothetical protein